METIIIAFIIITLGSGLLIRFFNIVKEFLKNILYGILIALGLLLFLRLFYKWILVPGFKMCRWLALKFWELMRWVGKKLDAHYSYRSDDNYWALVATSMDRKPRLDLIPN